MDPSLNFESRLQLQPSISRSGSSISSSVSSSNIGLGQYQTVSITKHYQVNNQILEAFQLHYENACYKLAYALGLRFVETALLEIPRHGYFTAARHERERMQSSLEAVRVTQLLQEMQRQSAIDDDGDDHDQQKMTITQQQKAHHIQQLAELAIRQVEEASTDQQERADVAKSLVRAQQVSPAPAAVLSRPRTARREQQDEHSVVYEAIPMAPPMNTATATVVQQAPPSTAAVLPRPITARREQRDEHSVVYEAIPIAPPMHTATATVTQTQHSYPQQQEQHISQRQPTIEPLESAPPPYASLSSSLHSIPPPPQLEAQPHISSFGDLPEFKSSASGSELELELEKALYLSGLAITSKDAGKVDEVTATQPPSLERQQAHMPQTNSSSMSSNISCSNSTGERGSNNGNNYNQSRDHRRRNDSISYSGHRLGVRTLSQLYHQDFDDIVRAGRARVSLASTYQGRLPGSTNGCTVIAPLLCMHHLFVDLDDEDKINNGSQSNNCDRRGSLTCSAITDATIHQVIDDETPAILQQVRHALGLSHQAFLIPQDVHDFLIQNGQLSQEQFLNVMGGNILDDTHLSALVDALVDTNDTQSDKDHSGNTQKRGNENSGAVAQHATASNQKNPRHEPRRHKKVAATLFFHEHVVTILKLRRQDRAGTTTWFDVIDSLPLKRMLQRVGESEIELDQRLGNSRTSSSSLPTTLPSDSTYLPYTARIRCIDAEALKACLRWYACSRFSKENATFIDMYAWDDRQADFDPRVFQAFLWGETPS